MRSKLVYAFLLAAVMLTGCRNDEPDFDNKVFINGNDKTAEMLVRADTKAYTQTLQAALAQPHMMQVDVTFAADVSKVATYNKNYGAETVLLPAENYSFTSNKATINAGSIVSNTVALDFVDLDQLNRDIVYCLPVTISKSSFMLLDSDITKYYIIKGAALINVVGDIEENYCTIDWQDPSVVNGLNTLTLEALIRARDFDRLISSVMGIEGKFLIRIGDAGYPSSQVQVATSGGNFPSADSNKKLPTNEWVHIAVTYDSSDGHSVLYINGKVQGERNRSLGAVNLGQGGTGGFCIGRSYSNDRYLAGEISEVRIWNVVRTQEEITNNSYYVSTESEGLVAYWKFNDNSDRRVKDHSGNGNDALANNPLKWTSVTLPAPGN